MTQSESRDLMSIDETAEYLRLHRNTVISLVKSKEIPGRKIGHAWRVSRRALMSWIEGPAMAAR